MIGKRYQLTFTDTTHRLIERLVGHGYNIRDILNAGTVLFYKADPQQRGAALAEATTIAKAELSDAMDVIYNTNIELLDDEDARRVAAIKAAWGPEAERSAAEADDMFDDAQNASRDGKADNSRHSA